VDGKKIIAGLKSLTEPWTKQRKTEDRNAAAAARRRHAFVRSARETIKDAAWDVMPKAYLQASSNNTLPAHARQVMYAARGHIQRQTGETLDAQYFTQTLLPDYLRENPETTADWDVVFDARGHFHEPHTGVIIPLGTIEVRNYLQESRGRKARDSTRPRRRRLYPTAGPLNRFSCVLFVEKEGFMPLFRRARLAERYDIAIMSTKGVSVTAARRLVDDLSGRKVRCLVVRDFDKAGFTIARTLGTSGRRYHFQNRALVTDLGLRLADTRQHNLLAEDVRYTQSDPRGNLRHNGASAEEVAFLCSGRQSGVYIGQRIELNAFASADLLQWIEGKLQEHGVRKVVPEEKVLREAFQRAYEERFLRRSLKELRKKAHDAALHADVPDDLTKLIEQELKAQPKLPRDRAVEVLAVELLEDEQG
jgi:hypothetical protein